MRRDGDRGSATVELVALTLLLLIPVAYLVLALARIQAGTYAAEQAAYSGARAAVLAGVAARRAGGDDAAAWTVAQSAAGEAARMAAEDFGLDPQPAAVVLSCDGACLAPGTVLSARVELPITLPGVPDAVMGHLPLAVTASATAASPVDGAAP